MNRLFRLFGALFSIIALTHAAPALAASGNPLDQEAAAALQSLYEQTPASRALGKQAEAILVFPRVVKAGFVVGAQSGDGVLFRKGKPAGHFNTSGVSAGFQAGAQSYGYVLFFMSDSAVRALANRDGWEVGVGPSIVVVDAGMARALTTTTAHPDIYAFFFDQKGLMAGAGLQGTRIKRIGE